MCQISKTGKFVELTEDLKVFKVGYEADDPNKMCSAYQDYYYTIGLQVDVPLEEIQRESRHTEHTYSVEQYTILIENGILFENGIHSFVSREDAQREKAPYEVLHEATIPKGAFVNRGWWDCGTRPKTIVSTAIIINARL